MRGVNLISGKTVSVAEYLENTSIIMWTYECNSKRVLTLILGVLKLNLNYDFNSLILHGSHFFHSKCYD